jgi:hypothetical protein
MAKRHRKIGGNLFTQYSLYPYMSDSDATEDEPADEQNESEAQVEENTLEISCSLGEIQLEVSGGTVEETEEVFERVWSERLSEAGQMSDALRDQLQLGYN